MIRLLGFKRILIIGLLMAVDVMLVFGIYFYATPQQMQKDQQLRGLNSQISEKQTDIDRIQIAFEQLKDQQSIFDELRERGFFSNQGRREAEMVLERIQTESGVISAVANIQPGEIQDNEEALKADYKILQSLVNIKIQALDDVDIYRYLYLLQHFFPGHVTIETMELVRKGELNDAVLRGIATGKVPPLVEADLFLIWRTMIPQNEIVGGEGG